MKVREIPAANCCSDCIKKYRKKIRQNKKSEREGHERCLIYKMKNINEVKHTDK